MATDIPEYDELEIRISRVSTTEYRVVAVGEPERSSAARITGLPFDDRDIAILAGMVGRRTLPSRSRRSTHIDELKKFGGALFNAVFSGEIRDIYDGARRYAGLRNRGLRIKLLIETPDLMSIPWELLYERPGFLAQSVHTPLVRSLDVRSTRLLQEFSPPLKIVAMASAPYGFATLDSDTERYKLERAVMPLLERGMVQIIWLERATLRELHRVLSAPDQIHVLHYIGHGEYDSRTANGVLVLEDEERNPREVTGEELGWVLRDELSLRLAVLNACEGARGSAIDPFSGVATALIEAGLSAVVGMQFEITDDAAISFADSFYTAIAQAYPIDAAVASARTAIWAAGYDTEFATPVLFARGDTTRPFRIQSEAAPGKTPTNRLHASTQPAEISQADSNKGSEVPALDICLVPLEQSDRYSITVKAIGDSRSAEITLRDGMFNHLADYSEHGDNGSIQELVDTAWPLMRSEMIYPDQRRLIREALVEWEQPVVLVKCATLTDTFRPILMLITTCRLVWCRQTFFGSAELGFSDLSWIQKVSKIDGGLSIHYNNGLSHDFVNFSTAGTTFVPQISSRTDSASLAQLIIQLSGDRSGSITEAMGKTLFKLIFPSRLADLYRKARQSAECAPHRMMVTLRGVDRRIEWVQWETLHDGSEYLIANCDIARKRNQLLAERPRRTFESALLAVGTRSDPQDADRVSLLMSDFQSRIRMNELAEFVTLQRGVSVDSLRRDLIGAWYSIVVLFASVKQSSMNLTSATLDSGDSATWMASSEFADLLCKNPPHLVILGDLAWGNLTGREKSASMHDLIWELLDRGKVPAVLWIAADYLPQMLSIATVSVLTSLRDGATAEDALRVAREVLSGAMPEIPLWACMTLYLQ